MKSSCASQNSKNDMFAECSANTFLLGNRLAEKYAKRTKKRNTLERYFSSVFLLCNNVYLFYTSLFQQSGMF